MPNVDVNQLKPLKEDVQIVNVEVEETSREVPDVDLDLTLGLIDCETNAKAQISDLEDNSVAVDPSYTKKVMDDLDALLADLQSTTANISSYQHSLGQYNQEPNTSSYPQYYRNDGAPEGVDLGPHYQRLDHSRSGQDGRGYLGQEYHPPEDYQQRGTGSVVTVRRNSYNSSGENSGNSTPPPLPPPPPSEILDSIAYGRDQEPIYEQQTFHVRDTTPSSTSDGSEQITSQRAQVKVRGERMSALSNNLSELDQLLQDLNSAQFMAEVDRKSNKIKEVSVVNGGVSAKQPPPKVAAKPGQRTSVDNLLDELEIVGSQPGRFPTDPHYQELSTVTTNHSQYQREGGPAFIHNSAQSSTTSYAHPQTASTATRELDELMLSLSEFKLQNKPEVDANQEPAYAKPVKKSSTGVSPTSPLGPSPLSQQVPAERHQQFQQQQQYQIQRENGQLESMLGDLQSDMNRQGVNTKQKGVCAACQKSIVGQVIAALGRTWHVEHFVCAHCEVPLGTRNFYERDSLAYCEVDYHQLFAPRCAYCNGPIVDKCITALEKMWHPEHFFCAQCGRLFGEEDFHEKNGKAYCREDYFQMFAPKCGGCAKPIMDNYISALNRQWHPECFVCWECRATFGVGSFFDYEGLPYCETHYHAKKGSLCASCEKPITGRCITAMFKKFHPEHFVCAFCLKQLNKGTFKEQNDKPYCHPCFVKLFG